MGKHFSHKVTLFLKQQIELLLEPIIGHSRMVSVTKILLIAAAFILTAALIILPFTSQVNKNFRLTFSGVQKNTQTDLPEMLNPHLQGVDQNNQTYNVTAKSAIQETAERVILKDISADINLANSGWINLTAENGTFDHATSILKITGNINIFSKDSYEFSTNSAHIDMKKRIMTGQDKISGQGPAGTITADSFIVNDETKSIILKGNVRLVVYSLSEQ